jgi:hypothetical protein
VGWRARADERKILHSQYMMIKCAVWIITQRHGCKTPSHATSVRRVEGNQNMRVDIYKFLEFYFVHLGSKDTAFLRTTCTVCVSFQPNCCLLKKSSNLLKKKLFTFFMKVVLKMKNSVALNPGLAFNSFV